jgi:hypothetical protein
MLILSGSYNYLLRKLIFFPCVKNRQEWYRKMIALKFTQEEAGEYAGLFVANDVEMNMIPELNDGVLKSIGIEKAGQ